jgi:hypothetical protein
VKLAQALIEVGVILLVMLLSVTALLMIGVWILWGVFGNNDDLS